MDDPRILVDWEMFPHILDSILYYSSDETLSALRATSRAFRSKVDAIFATHVVFNEWNRVPGTPAGNKLPCSYQKGVLPDHLMPRVNVVDMGLTHKPSSPSIKVVGVRRGSVRATKPAPKPKLDTWHGKNVQVVRTNLQPLVPFLMQFPQRLPPARQLIAFIPISRQTRVAYVHTFPDTVERVVFRLEFGTGCVEYFPTTGSGTPPSNTTVQARPGTATLVLPCSPTALPNTLREMVIIYPDRSRPHGSLQPLLPLQLHGLNDLLESHPAIKFTIVGEDQFGRLPNIDKVDVASKMSNFRVWSSQHRAGPLAAMVSGAEYHSHNRYREIVGDDQYRLETKWKW